jgi:hypothetical protein
MMRLFMIVIIVADCVLSLVTLIAVVGSEAILKRRYNNRL